MIDFGPLPVALGRDWVMLALLLVLLFLYRRGRSDAPCWSAGG